MTGRAFLSIHLLGMLGLFRPGAPPSDEPCQYVQERASVGVGVAGSPYRRLGPAPRCPHDPLPVVIALHGYGGTEDSWFNDYDAFLAQAAVTRGFVLAAPAAYPRGRAVGWSVNAAWPDREDRRNQDLSEQAVLETLVDLRKRYTVNPARVFLIGHSMGGLGAWQLGKRFPEVFSAIASFSGPTLPAEQYGNWRVPALVVHGAADTAVDVAEVRAVVALLRVGEARVVYVEVPGGSHRGVVQPNLSAALEFFGLPDARR